MRDELPKQPADEGRMSTQPRPPAVPGGQSAGHSAVDLDSTDRAIITELVRDGRAAIRALAEKVHISRANAYARIARLQDSGAIRGFTVRLDPLKVGLGTTAYVALTLDQYAWRTVSEGLRGIPCIESFALLGADYDVLALVRAADNAELRRVVLEQIQDLPGVRSTRTWLVFEEVEGHGIEWNG
jgi:DNA-binding Lrp family transcriptional regulator